MTSKWLERSSTSLPCGGKLMKHVDLDEPTSCLDHALLGCTQRECEANDSIIDQYKDVLNHESLLQ